MVCLFRELFHLSKVPFVRQFSNLSKPFSLANLKGFERSDNSMANALYIRGLKEVYPAGKMSVNASKLYPLCSHCKPFVVKLCPNDSVLMIAMLAECYTYTLCMYVYDTPRVCTSASQWSLEVFPTCVHQLQNSPNATHYHRPIDQQWTNNMCSQ